MKKYTIVDLILIILLMFLSGCSAINNFGSDIQYHMLLSGHSSGYTVLKQWNGRGNVTTENFTVKSDKWVLYTSNTPDSSDWENNRGYLKITFYSSSKSEVILDTYRPNETGVDVSDRTTYGTGPFHMVIESSNTRFIVRVQIEQGNDLVLNAVPVPMKGNYINILKGGLPLGCDWAIQGTLTSPAGTTPTIGKTLHLYEDQNNSARLVQDTKTVAKDNTTNPNEASFWFRMLAKTIPGTYNYQIMCDVPNEPIYAVDFIFTVTTTRAVYLSLDSPARGGVGEQFYVTATLKDYLGDQPVTGAPIKLACCPKYQSNWTTWNTNLVTDQSGQAKIDLGKSNDLVFPGIGDWDIKALFPGSKVNGIDYQPVESSSHQVSYEKGTPVVNLSLRVPPSVSFTPFKLSCTITSEEGQPISGQLTGELDVTKGSGTLSLPMGAFNQDNTTPIVFTLSLESGSYTLRASFMGNKYYDSAVSNDLLVKFGQ